MKVFKLYLKALGIFIVLVGGIVVMTLTVPQGSVKLNYNEAVALLIGLSLLTISGIKQALKK